ncbi:hypothetical protein [Roseibium sp. Sym1]|uniref:hypothetical protein n=1 Tax=Roseibium sp. Sym1 TaxID=3016006 RepID=UPI0022B3B2E5|nr:hypothetical protein [Roseibium sp. Sym1]
MSGSNNLRTVGDLVAMQGWVQKTNDVSRFTLHLHLSFDQARIGGGSNASVNFKLVVKRCHVEVEIPAREGITYDQASVDMDVPMQAQIMRALQEAKAERSEPREPITAQDFGAKFNDSYRGRNSENAGSEKGFTVPIISSEYKPTGPRQLCWKLRPETTEFLQGPVWNAKDEPRFTVVDRRSPARRKSDTEKGFQPFVRVSLRCKREDIELLEISLKDQERNSLLLGSPKHSVRVAAAEAYLKTVMFQEGLQVGNLSDVFSDLLLAEYLLEVKP